MSDSKLKTKSSFQKILYFLGILILLGLGFFYFYVKPAKTPENSQNSSNKSPATQNLEKTQDEETTLPEISFSESYDLKVPFAAQAPYALWDDLHNNACEEASILLVHAYKQGWNLTRELAEKEIQAMVAYQIKKYGRHKDLTSQETADLTREFYGYKDVEIIYDFSWDKVKSLIYQGHPLIIPAAGRLLENPNFKRPGPIYHMLVIRGYTPTEIITNDVGTRKGEGYRYTYDILDRAIHDWTGDPNTISSGRRAIIVIKD